MDRVLPVGEEQYKGQNPFCWGSDSDKFMPAYTIPATGYEQELVLFP